MTLRTRLAAAALIVASTTGARAGDDVVVNVQTKSGETPVAVAASAKKYDFPAQGVLPKMNDAAYANLVKNHGSDILVVNFWATWCGPCVEEIPDFVEVSKKNPSEKVRFVGISLDLDKQVDTHVVPFLKKTGVEYPNFLLDADDPDAFITSVSKAWQGAIPATFIYDRAGGTISEHLSPLTKTELAAAVDAALTQVKAAHSATEAATIAVQAGAVAESAAAVAVEAAVPATEKKEE